MTPKINQIEPEESINNENVVNESINNVSSKGESKLKKAINNAIAKLWIALSLTGGTGAFNVISLGTTGAIVAACEKPDDTGPEITKEVKEITISGGEIFIITGNQVKVGNTVIHQFRDDVSNTNVTISSSFDRSTISSGKPINQSGALTSTATDQAGNPSKTAKTQINVKPEVDNNQAPKVTREYPQDKVPNILGGITAKGDNNQLTFGDIVMYTGKDDNTPVCTISLKLKGSDEEKVGKKISESNTYVLTYTDKDGKSSDPIEFPVISESIDLTNLGDLNMQVNQEVDLLEGINVPSGIEITKVEMEINGQRQEVKAKDGRYLYTPDQAGTCYIYVTEKGEFGNTYTESSSLTIKDIEYPEYQSITLESVRPTEVFPQISQIESGDPNIYEYVKDLGIAEIYVMTNMMSEYGTGEYTAEEYQQLLSRMNMGLINEGNDDYQNNLRIGPIVNDPYISDHARGASQNLTILKGKYTSIKNLSDLGEGRAKNLSDYAKTHPNDMFIFSCSATPTAYSQDTYKKDVFNQNIVDLCDLPNVIIFVAGGDTKTVDGIDLKIIYNGFYDELMGDGRYLYSSMANSDQDNYPNSNMRIVIGNHPSCSVDITHAEGSLFPFRFASNATVSGHPILPIYQKSGKLRGEDRAMNGGYFSSYVTPAVASEVQMIFGLRADVKDANKLLEIIENNTTTPDHIYLNGEGLEIPKYSPKNVAEDVCIIADVPSTIKPGETIMLTKGRYLGLVFDIPGAEVFINGKWIPYNKDNESLIKSQNPMNLEWRISGDEGIKYGKKALKGKIRTVNDKWESLDIEKDISIEIQ